MFKPILIGLLILFLLVSCANPDNKPNPSSTAKWNEAKWDSSKWEK
jgi:hypothetical protein